MARPDNMASPDLQSAAYEYAIRLLSMKMRTVGELQDKLKQKKYPPKIIIEVIRSLEELDFVNDERYAQIYVENLKRYRDYGYYGIKSHLLKKRVPTDIAEKVLEEFLTGEEELAVAERLLGKLKRQGRKEYEKIARSMNARGFRTEVISALLRDL